MRGFLSFAVVFRTAPTGRFFAMVYPQNTPPPVSRSLDDLPKNVLPHLLRNSEYDLEWLKWAVTQTYLEPKTLRDIANRIKEIESL